MSPASALPSAAYYGVNVQPLLTNVASSRWAAFLGQASHDSLRSVRLNAAWAWVEPTAPNGTTHTYQWTRPGRIDQSLDDQMTAVATQGLQPLAVIATPPSWAGSGSATVTPQHYADLAAFAGAYTRRYGPGGSFWTSHPKLIPKPVTQYEVWTEANSTISWTGSPNPAEYVKGLDLVSSAIHAADPSAQVLGSLGWQDFENFTNSLYADGIKGHIDGMAFHPYAPTEPGIVDLVTRLRARLVANGDGGLPIDVTEIGQPRAPSSQAPAAHAFDGYVTDQARAATQSLAGDALAHSDCGVTNYLIYGITGSETAKEPLNEGYMGIYNIADATPNATGKAIRDGEARWTAAPSGGLALCSPGVASASLLPLGLQLTRNGATCVNGVVTYYGNPIEGPDLALRSADGSADGGVDAFGNASACLPSDSQATSFTVVAFIGNTAQSVTYTCDVTSPQTPCVMSTPTGRTPISTPLPTPPNTGTTGTGTTGGTQTGGTILGGPQIVTGGSAGTGTTSGAAPSATGDTDDADAAPGSLRPTNCTYRLTLAVLHRKGRKVRARARLTCGTALIQRMAVTMFVRRKHSKHRAFLRRVYVIAGQARAFTVHVRLHRGDRLDAVRPVAKSLGVPRLAAGVTAK